MSQTEQPYRKLISQGDSYVEAIILPEILGGRPCMYIHKVWVEEAKRGTGLGKKLLEDAVKLAKEEGCHKVFLITKLETAKFYQMCGFDGDQIGMVLRLG
jgi:N-acetylglutamate synthase-like GNAT family acetyltransferase